jgi:hypothetical protein
MNAFSSDEAFRTVVKHRGVNITENNVDNILEILKDHDIKNEEDLNKLNRYLWIKEAFLRTLPAFAGGIGALIGGPPLAVVANVATAGAVNGDQRKSMKDRIKSAAGSFASSFVNADLAQPLVEAITQFAVGTSDTPLSHDIVWLDGKEIPKIKTILTSFEKTYAEQARLFGKELLYSCTDCGAMMSAAVKTVALFVDDFVPHSAAFFEAAASSVHGALKHTPKKSAVEIEMQDLSYLRLNNPDEEIIPSETFKDNRNQVHGKALKTHAATDYNTER